MVLTKQNHHQRGESIVVQGILPFKYETEKKTTGMTALGESWQPKRMKRFGFH
jgi:hypothetical protein